MKTYAAKLLSILLVITLFGTILIVSGVSAEEAESLYVTAVNAKVTAGSGTVFTKGFNGTGKIISNPQGGGNFRWATVFGCEPTNIQGVFEVVSFDSNLADELEVTIPEGGFVYAAHYDDSDVAGMKDKSDANMKIIKKVNVGDYVTIDGFNLEDDGLNEGAKIFLGNTKGEDAVSKDSESKPEGTESSEPEEESDTAGDISKQETSREQEDTIDSENESVTEDGTSEDKDGGEGISTYLIIGIIAGALALVGVIAFIKKRQKTESSK